MASASASTVRTSPGRVPIQKTTMSSSSSSSVVINTWPKKVSKGWSQPTTMSCFGSLAGITCLLMSFTLILNIGRGGAANPAPLARSGGGLDFGHALAQHPQRPVQPHIAIDAGDGAGGRAAARLRIAGADTALDDGLLNPVEGVPEIGG